MYCKFFELGFYNFLVVLFLTMHYNHGRNIISDNILMDTYGAVTSLVGNICLNPQDPPTNNLL